MSNLQKIESIKESCNGIVRPMRENESLHVMAIWAAYVQKYHSFLSHKWMAETRLLMSTQYLQASEVYVYQYHDRIVGFVGMVANYVGLLFVESEYEGQGFASELLNQVNTRDGNLVTSAYSKNKDGSSFYERHGFVFDKETLHEESGEQLSYYHLPKNSEGKSSC